MPHATKDDANRNKRQRCERRREEIVKLLGGVCIKCGISDIRVLHVDHIHAKHLGKGKYGRGGHGLYRMILNGTLPKEDFQLLCCNCNWIKRLENHEDGDRYDNPNEKPGTLLYELFELRTVNFTEKRVFTNRQFRK